MILFWQQGLYFIESIALQADLYGILIIYKTEPRSYPRMIERLQQITSSLYIIGVVLAYVMTQMHN